MADPKITDYAALGGAPATNDLIEVVDVSDTSMAATGTNKKMTVANLLSLGRTVLDRQVAGAGGVASFDFTSISQAYENLQVTLLGRSTNAGAIITTLRFNNDSTAVYDMQTERAAAAVVSGGESLTQTSLQFGSMPGSGATAGRPGLATVFIPGYTRGFSKIFRSESSRVDGTSSGNVILDTFTGVWRPTSAITRITLLPGAGNFDENTVATLEGMA